MSHLLKALAALTVCAWVAGCSNDSSTVTSKTSKYEVADDSSGSSSTAAAPSAASSSAAAAEAPTAQDAVPPPDKVGTSTPERPAPLSSESASSPSEGATTQATPPRTSAPPLTEEQKLLRTISLLQRQQEQPRGTTAEEQMMDFTNIQRQIVQAADSLWQLQPKDTKILLAGAQAKIQALSFLDQTGARDARGLLANFSAELEKHSDPVVASFGRQAVFAGVLDAFAGGEIKDAQQVTDAYLKLLDTEKQAGGLNQAWLELAQQVASRLMDKQLFAEAATVLRTAAEKFADSPDADLKAGAESLFEQAKLAEVDLRARLLAVVEKQPQAVEKLSETLDKLVTGEHVGLTIFSVLRQISSQLEYIDIAAAAATFEALDKGFSQHSNPEIAQLVKEMVAKSRVRLGLLGQPFSVEGVQVNGQPFDWAAYQGKVVLIDFWATWCGPCLEELPNVRQNFNKYREQGFEVVGVNIDEEPSQLKRFLELQELPWTTVVSADPQKMGWEHPMVVKCGVDSIPFLVLVGRDGTAVALNTRGEQLGERLAEIFGPTDPAATSPASATPESATSPPAEPSKTQPNDAPSSEKPAEKSAEQPAPESSSRTQPQRQERFFFVGLTDEPTAAADKPADDEQPLKLDDINPYQASPGLTSAELVEFIFNMQEKPKSIQNRAGFGDAIVEAAERVLAAQAEEKYQVVAVLAKFEALHRQASRGNATADAALQKFTSEMQADPREKIARQAAFYGLERRVLEAESLSPEQLRELLVEVKTFTTEAKLTASHLRLASATVGAINRLEDAHERELFYQELGTLFAKSKDKELAAYGRRIASAKATQVADLVGKPLELAGATALGVALDWSSYRGRVVLVDFWATWCGACRQETPAIKALYERLHGQGFDVVGVSVDRDLDALGEYLHEQQFAWATLAGDDALAASSRYGIMHLPTMLLVDRDGKIAAQGHQVSDLASAVEKLLAGS